MHIPDGFLSPPVWGAFDLLSAPAVGILARRSQRETDHRKIPLLGVMGAFVFAAQMINFPVGIGTSGHLVGGALLAIVLGPSAAAMVMTAILAIQAFVFQDGGILALGTNVFNMAIVGVLAGYLPYRLWGSKWRSASIFAGGFLSVLCSGCLALSELLVSGVSMPRKMLFASIGLFAVSALVEAIITLAAVRAIERLNPASIRVAPDSGSRVFGVLAISAVVLAVLGILIASSAPEVIERYAIASPAWLHSPFANYQVAGIASPWLKRALAGVAGLGLIYGACVLGGRFMKRSA
jgi:cobalt/nickel transport system permease protein